MYSNSIYSKIRGDLQRPPPPSPETSLPLFPHNPPLKVKVLSSPHLLKIWLEVQPKPFPLAETGGEHYEVVPQGSVSAPIFFNIYLNDLFNFLRCDVCNSLMIQHLIYLSRIYTLFLIN